MKKKNEKLRYADALKTAKKDKDVLTETWIELNNEKKYRGKLDWTIVKKRLVDKFYDKYYRDFSNILRKWLELHRDYDPSKKAPGERETALAEIRGVDYALTDAGNKLNLLIYYINTLTWDPINNRYINDNENGYAYHQYALPEDYIKDFEDTGLISGDITDETLESIIDFLIDKRHAELEEKPEYTGNVGYFPPSDLNYVYTNPDVFDDNYNARTSAMNEGYGGFKPKKRYSRSKKMTMKRRIKNGIGKSKKLRKKHILKNSSANKK